MGLRVEYILFVALVVLFGFIFREQPNDIKAIESNSLKEIYFKNLSLVDLSENGIDNQLLSSSIIKYKNSFELKDVNATYKKTHTILAKKALYKYDTIYLEDNIFLKKGDEFSFSTNSLIYSMDDKIAHTDGRFVLDINGSRVTGEKLHYNLEREEVLADRVKASLHF
jgi:LPS export ABC transporter protein LptC